MKHPCSANASTNENLYGCSIGSLTKNYLEMKRAWSLLLPDNAKTDKRSDIAFLRSLLVLGFVFVVWMGGVNAQTKLTVNLDTAGSALSPSLYGIFFEDINHAADGGVYAELISNRSFENNSASPDGWQLVQSAGSSGSISLDTAGKLNSSQTYSLKITGTTIAVNGEVGVCNGGFWGINIVNGQQYTLNLFAKCNSGFAGKIAAKLENSAGTVVYATDTITGLTDHWAKYTCILTAVGSNPQGRLSLTMGTAGTIWLDVVSLFPPTYKNRPNGLRGDLAQMLADLKPKFMRFPGGCFVEGDNMANRFPWKKTIGNIENRPGHYNLWGYRTSDGMGYHEFLQLAEDIGAESLYVINVGLAHNDNVTYTQLDPLIQDALDAIEYAKGDATTTYGAMRVANGHPEPFHLKYVEIGNENSYGDHYAERYLAFYNAIKAKYPEIMCIGNVEAWGTDNPSWKLSSPTDIVDEHYYRDPQWFINQASKYDTYSRTGPKVYVGEYAVTSGCGNGNLIAAVGEAAYMTGLERNSDIVSMSSYAPIFVNVNDRKWNPDIINFNSSQSFGTPSYYVQKLFSENIGDTYIPIKEENNIVPQKPITGSIGVGTWLTQVQYDSALVKNDKATLFSDYFSNSTSNWSVYKGTWSVTNGVYAQTGSLDDCRSIASNISDTSYVYSLKAMRTSGNEGFLIIFGYTDASNYYWWNIGGWNNTKHAIERATNGSKSTIASTTGSIVSNKWYSIKVVINKGAIKCYLDNVLIHDFQPNKDKYLYVSTTKNAASGEIFMKVVNASDIATNSIINCKDNSAGVVLNGTATVLTSANKLDENSLTNPTNVFPLVSDITNSSACFAHSFPANSVTVFNLKKVGTETSVKDKTNTKKNGLLVYPNPSRTNSFTVELPDLEFSKPVFLSFIDGAGRSVLNCNYLYNGKRKFSINGLKNGMYNVVVKTNLRTFSQKVVLAR
jgi:alpha-L-arabinofuranosidase